MIVLSTDMVENSVCVDFTTLVAYNIIINFCDKWSLFLETVTYNYNV